MLGIQDLPPPQTDPVVHQSQSSPATEPPVSVSAATPPLATAAADPNLVGPTAAAPLPDQYVVVDAAAEVPAPSAPPPPASAQAPAAAASVLAPLAPPPPTSAPAPAVAERRSARAPKANGRLAGTVSWNAVNMSVVDGRMLATPRSSPQKPSSLHGESSSARSRGPRQSAVDSGDRAKAAHPDVCRAEVQVQLHVPARFTARADDVATSMRFESARDGAHGTLRAGHRRELLDSE